MQGEDRDTRLKQAVRDMRDTLNAVTQYARNAYALAEDPEAVREYLGRIDAAGRFLQSLTDDCWEILQTEPQAGAPEKEPELTQEDLEDLAGKRILLVDDNEIDADVASMILDLYEVETETAESGETAAAMIRDNGDGYYHAVLMNLDLPDMSGIDTARTVRGFGGTYFRRLPIIGVSIDAPEEDIRTALSVGMDDHILKPFDPEQLVRMLRRLM